MAKTCSICGAAMEDHKKFCTQCGGSLAEAPTVQAPPAPEPIPQPEPQPAPRQAPRDASRPAAQPQYQVPPVYQAPLQTAYAPQPAYGEIPPVSGSKYEPMTTGGYIGAMLLMCIPKQRINGRWKVISTDIDLQIASKSGPNLSPSVVSMWSNEKSPPNLAVIFH